MYKGFYVGVIIVECMALIVSVSFDPVCMRANRPTNRPTVRSMDANGTRNVVHICMNSLYFSFSFSFAFFIWFQFYCYSWLISLDHFSFCAHSTSEAQLLVCQPISVCSAFVVVIVAGFVFYEFDFIVAMRSSTWFRGANIIHSNTKSNQ